MVLSSPSWSSSRQRGGVPGVLSGFGFGRRAVIVSLLLSEAGWAARLRVSSGAGCGAGAEEGTRSGVPRGAERGAGQRVT